MSKEQIHLFPVSVEVKHLTKLDNKHPMGGDFVVEYVGCYGVSTVLEKREGI